MSEIQTKPAPIGFDAARGGVQIRTLDDAARFANAMMKSGLVPSSLKTTADVIVALQAGAELGLKPMTSLQYIAPINGRPCLWGEGAKAVVFATGQVEEWEDWWELDGLRLDGEPSMPLSDDVTAVTRIKRRSGGEVIRRYSVQMAKTAKLWGKTGPWTTNPTRMLQVRSMTRAMRDLFSDALGGLGMADEVSDSPPAAAKTSTLADMGVVTVDVPGEVKTEEPDPLEEDHYLDVVAASVRLMEDVEPFLRFCDEKHGLATEIVDAEQLDRETLAMMFAGNPEALRDAFAWCSEDLNG